MNQSKSIYMNFDLLNQLKPRSVSVIHDTLFWIDLNRLLQLKMNKLINFYQGVINIIWLVNIMYSVK